MAIVRHFGVVLLKPGKLPCLVQGGTNARTSVMTMSSSVAFDYEGARELLHSMSTTNPGNRYEICMLAWEDAHDGF